MSIGGAQAEEAMRLYAAIFERSKVIAVNWAGERVMSVQFELEGQAFMALNAGPQFQFTEAISFFVGCETQEEIDELWTKLTADRGSPSRCGWLKDKFGLSWQIVPAALGPDAGRPGSDEIAAGHERHAPDGQARSRAAAGGIRRKVSPGEAAATFSQSDPKPP
jgi:predicted 3-demethylubiquinone-9 3-methyltransferase (glyoxalase superfamily)